MSAGPIPHNKKVAYFKLRQAGVPVYEARFRAGVEFYSRELEAEMPSKSAMMLPIDNSLATPLGGWPRARGHRRGR